MPDQRKLSQYDLPLICLFTGIVLALTATFFIVSAKRNLIAKAELIPVSGTLQKVEKAGGKGGSYFDLHLKTSDGTHNLSQEDISGVFPALTDLHAGDTIDALVLRRTLGPDRYWEIRRDGTVILSYDETNQFFIDGQKRTAPLAQYIMRISVIFLAGAIFLRICLGRWTGNKLPADTDATAPSPN